jgi:hypothetical protein
MRRHNRSLKVIGFLCALLGIAIWGHALTHTHAQVPGVPSLNVVSPTGNEQIRVEGLGPQVEIIRLAQVRDAIGYLTVAAGTTVTTQAPNSASELIASGAITTWNLNLALAPYDGLRQRVSCPGGNTGTLTITATLPAGVAIVGVNPTSCTESSALGATFVYALAANTWYRVD